MFRAHDHIRGRGSPVRFGSNSRDKMTPKIINKILSGLFLADYAYWLFFIIIMLMPWTTITDCYTGTTLLLFIGKICLHVSLGIAVVIFLFINHNKGILITTPLYIAQIFISKIWHTNPNSPKFLSWIKATEQNIESGNVTYSDAMATVYPFTFIYVFYILSVVYILFVMPKRKNKNAQP